MLSSNSSESASKLFFSGSFVVSRNISGPLELLIDVNQCDISMKQCDKYPSLRIPAFCQKLKDKKAFYYEAVSAVIPPFECPLTAQTYVLNNSSVDLSAFAFLPLSGTVWLLTSKIMSGKNREVVSCCIAEFKIVRRKGRKRN